MISLGLAVDASSPPGLLHCALGRVLLAPEAMPDRQHVAAAPRKCPAAPSLPNAAASSCRPRQPSWPGPACPVTFVSQQQSPQPCSHSCHHSCTAAAGGAPNQFEPACRRRVSTPPQWRHQCPALSQASSSADNWPHSRRATLNQGPKPPCSPADRLPGADAPAAGSRRHG